MNVLIFGANGQLGFELRRAAWPAGTTLICHDIDTCDITDERALLVAFQNASPTVVVNAAAYTAVDKAETNRDAAFAVNTFAPGKMAEFASHAHVPLIHVSTDYVFDGTKVGAYREDDAVHPLGVYGETKEAGERAVREHLNEYIILRTAWVYGSHGQNFVKTMLRFGKEREEMRVVADQHGCPTAATDLASAIVHVTSVVTESRKAPWGTYHFAGSEPTTWHGFADEIFEHQKRREGRRPALTAITTADYPTPARRPANSVLDCEKYTATFGVKPRPWREALAEVIAELYRP